MGPKDVDGVANSVDPDQTALRFDLGLHCLPRPVCRKLRIVTVNVKPQNIGESRLLAQRAAPSYHIEVIEPRHDKTNKVTVRQSLRCPHEESLGSLLPIAKTLFRLGAQSLCWFCHIAAQL